MWITGKYLFRSWYKIVIGGGRKKSQLLIAIKKILERKEMFWLMGL